MAFKSAGDPPMEISHSERDEGATSEDDPSPKRLRLSTLDVGATDQPNDDVQNMRLVSSHDEIFPHLVWVDIGKNLNFQDTVHLTKVLPSLCGIITPGCQFETVFPLLFKSLDKKDVLKLRHVCNWWKQTIDNFLEEHTSRKPYDSNRSVEVESSSQYCTLEAKSMKYICVDGSEKTVQRIKDAQNQVDMGVKIPMLVGRSVDITLLERDSQDGQQQPSLSYKTLLQFLEIWGDQIWYVKFSIYTAMYTSYVRIYRKLQSCLQKIPNLKSLELEMQNEAQQQVARISTGGRMHGKKFKSIAENAINAHPLPALPLLETLEFSGEIPFGHEGTLNLQNELIKKYGGTVKKLTVKTEYDLNYEGIEFMNVQELQVNCLYDRRGQELRSIMTNLRAPQLKKLGIAHGYCTLDSMFWIAENLNLEAFSCGVLFSDVPVNARYPLDYADLPTLQSVTAFILQIDERNGDRLPLQVLRLLPKLTYLEIQNTGHVRSTDKFHVDFGADIGKVSIWELLPQLKMYVVGEKRYVKIHCKKNEVTVE